jgi:alkaline phosphatase D
MRGVSEDLGSASDAMRRIGLIVFSLMLAAVSARGAEVDAPTLTHGVASGDVTDSSAVIWAAVDGPAELRVRVQPIVGSEPAREVVGSSAEPPALTAIAKLEGLEPGTDYRYEVWFANAAGRSAIEAGKFMTAPAASVSRAVAFIWSGDLGGQRYCRRADRGYAIFAPMAEFAPNFFVANGDMIYADNDCPKEGPVPGWTNVPGGFPSLTDASVNWSSSAAVDAVYAAHWRYNRADAAFQRFLRGTSMYVQWDDHEVTNDFAARSPVDPAQPSRAGFAQLVAAGRRWLFAFHPIARDRADPDRIYRSVRWGRELELFMLDARSYRSANELEDSDANAKTILGAEQRAWLESGLSRSTATWKIVSSDVPLSVPTGSSPEARGRDAFASGEGPGLAGSTGFERELVGILKTLDRKRVRNVVFVATDVHFAAQLRYAHDFDGDGQPLVFHELIAGPLSAFRAPAPPAFDPTLKPVVLYAEGDLFNFGTVRVDPSAAGGTVLRTDVRDETGAVRPGSELVLLPQR